VKAAYGDETPLVVDSFAGGGSIPLEALRLGCEAFASDLNPVACLILKVMLEDIPRHGPQLADELRRAGVEIQQTVESELADYYPRDLGGASPIAYLWARTVRCESPNCGAEIPLMRSFWLCKKPNRVKALRHRVVPNPGHPPSVVFEIFEPDAEKDVPGGTVTRAKATCVACRVVLPPERVRAQLTAQRGGADVIFGADGRRQSGAQLVAVVTLKAGETGRGYRLASHSDYEAVRKAQSKVAQIFGEWERGGRQGLCPIPDEATPAGGGSGAGRAFSMHRYGMLQWGDLFTARQKLALVTVAREVAMRAEGREKDLLALMMDRVVARNSSLSWWRYQADQEKVEAIFGRQVLSMVWGFAEAVPISTSTGSILDGLDQVCDCVASLASITTFPGTVQQADAASSVLPADSAAVWFTDPPYYDAVPYADLSDFVFVWLKRMLPKQRLVSEELEAGNQLTPKAAEIVQDETKSFEGSPKDRNFFEQRMAQAFAAGADLIKPDAIACVVFAHKTTEGWEALLSGMTRGGWTITGSWPIATEMGARLRARESAALGTSVHLVCRPRREDAGVGDWGGVLRELPNRVGDWMERLQGEGVRGADLVFACIGPALEIFSRYAKVEAADGREVTLAEYLVKVWEIVGRTALEQVLGTAEAKARNGAAGALEEDARLTALFLWTLQSTNGETPEGTSDKGEVEESSGEDDDNEGAPASKGKGFTLVFDVVRRFAQPLGIDLPKWEGRVIETNKGVVRLLPITERARQLFGDDGAQTVAARLEQEGALGRNPLQGLLFPDAEAAPIVRGRGRISEKRAGVDALSAARDATTLDRIHAAMLLQASGRTNALRALLKAEQERGSDFLRLANALSALYPKASEEKRLLDAMLLAVPR
jgi:adenine-specific DNA methylase